MLRIIKKNDVQALECFENASLGFTNRRIQRIQKKQWKISKFYAILLREYFYMRLGAEER